MVNSIAFLGVMSSGKDVTATAFLKDCLNKKPLKIISNCYLNFPRVTMISTEELYLKHKDPEFFRNSYLYITEMHTILESRSSTSLINKNFTMFLTQIGKLNCKVIYTSQLQGQIDLRLRQWTPYMFICEKFVLRNNMLQSPNFWDPRKLKEQIYINLTLTWVDIEGKEQFMHYGTITPTDEDFKLFDTEEIITLDREKFMRK